MDGDEKVRLLLIGDDGPVFERDKDVGFSRHNHVESLACGEQVAQLQRDIEHDIFLFLSLPADAAGSSPPCPGSMTTV
jgi:hypothetical protein